VDCWNRLDPAALGLWGQQQTLEALAYGIALIKGAWLLSRLERYRSAPIGGWRRSRAPLRCCFCC
jgi:hypothetical protein